MLPCGCHGRVLLCDQGARAQDRSHSRIFESAAVRCWPPKLLPTYAGRTTSIIAVPASTWPQRSCQEHGRRGLQDGL
eukprot:6323748-Pyramimonas_sp.AAC.1